MFALSVLAATVSASAPSDARTPDTEAATARAAADPTPDNTREAWNIALRSRVRGLEAEIGEIRGEDTSSPTIDELGSRLDQGEALLAFAAYTPASADRTSSTGWGALLYIGGRTKPIFVPLTESGARADSLVARWREEIAKDPRSHPDGSIQAEAQYREVASALRALLWDPIATAFLEPHTLFVTGDRPLATVDLATLPQLDGTFLVESEWTFHILGTELDLRAPRRPTGAAGVCAILEPDYDATTLFGNIPADGEGQTPDGLAPCLESRLHEHTWRDAPGDDLTRRLLGRWKGDRAFWKLWGGPGRIDQGDVLELRGIEATETRWKSEAPKHRVLAFGTSSFRTAPNDTCGGHTPLRTTGFALSGADHVHAALPGEDDGVITAAEICRLDLSGVDWTFFPGWSEEEPFEAESEGEVTLGSDGWNREPWDVLRRAFARAGCSSVLGTRWTVGDAYLETWLDRALPVRFVEGRDTFIAVREGRRAALERARDRRKSSHPFYWGSIHVTGSGR